jgi:uncharacterized membrane protein YsdA (DUF1294 family)
MTWRLATVTVWAALALGLLVGQSAAARAKWRIPTAAMALRQLTSGALCRGVLLVFWMWLGWHSFAR